MWFSSVTGLPSTTSATCVSTGLVRQFRGYYADVRLLADVPCTDCAFGFPCRSGCRLAPDADEVSRFSRVAVSRRALGSWTTPGLMAARVIVPISVAFPLEAHGRRPNCVFRSSIPGPSMPLSPLHLAPRGTRRKTRGQDGSLLLSCGALSSPTARRFIPTIALPHGRGSDWAFRRPDLPLEQLAFGVAA